MKLIAVVLFAIASCLTGAVMFGHGGLTASANAVALQGPPAGKIVLGDPGVSPEFGRNKKWGPVKNFDHGTHSQASYAADCQQCHHTNKDAKTEPVKKCTECHKAEGNDKNPTTKDGDEANIQDAFHGNPNNTTNNAGCIECHKKVNKAGKHAPTSCADCHDKKG